MSYRFTCSTVGILYTNTNEREHLRQMKTGRTQIRCTMMRTPRKVILCLIEKNWQLTSHIVIYVSVQPISGTATMTRGRSQHQKCTTDRRRVGAKKTPDPTGSRKTMEIGGPASSTRYNTLFRPMELKQHKIKHNFFRPSVVETGSFLNRSEFNLCMEISTSVHFSHRPSHRASQSRS